MFRIGYAFPFILLTLFGTGCSPGPKMAEVVGTIKVGGQALEKIQIEFLPEADGPRSRGLTDSQGRFTLNTDDGLKKGAVVGKHRIILTDVGILGDKLLGRAGEDVDMAQGKKPRIADMYCGVQSTPLNKEVVADKVNEFEFVIEPPGK
jgi:hypothetical protein